MVWRPYVWYCIPAVRSPSQHMHIVFISERLVPLKLACTIYYATWNQKVQRLDYVSQASLQLGPWGQPLVCTHGEESLPVHSLQVFQEGDG